MRPSRVLRIALLAVLCLLPSVTLQPAASAQSPNAVNTPDKTAIIAYRTLFWRTLSYNKLADTADAQGDPKPHLRHVIANHFQLSSEYETGIQRLALAYQTEIDPIHQQARAVAAKFRALYPQGIIPNIANVTSPPELRELQGQEDSITLRYREMVRNTMQENDFQMFDAKVIESFGGGTQ